MSRPISRKREPGSSSACDAFARGQFAGAVLLFDALRAAAFAQLRLEALQIPHQMMHARQTRLLSCGVREIFRHPSISVPATGALPPGRPWWFTAAGTTTPGPYPPEPDRRNGCLPEP